MCEHGYRLGEDWRHHFSASEHQNPAGRRSPDGVLPWRCYLLTDESRSDGILPIWIRFKHGDTCFLCSRTGQRVQGLVRG